MTGPTQSTIAHGVNRQISPNRWRKFESEGQSVGHGKEVVDPGRGVRSHLHVALGHHHRDRRLADHPVGTARQLQRRAVGHRRLRPDAGVGASDGRFASRPLRAPIPVHRRPHCLHPRLAALRDSPVADHVDPVPQRPRHRRGHPVRHLAGSSGSELPRQGAGDGFRNLGCGHRGGRRTRTSTGRGHHHRHQLAGHLLGQPARRGGRPGRHPVAGG